MVDKVIRDGMVAVLVSRGYGAGWSSWDYEGNEQMLFDPVMVAILEKYETVSDPEKKWDELETYAKEKYPDAYLGGIDGLTVEWLPVGTIFKIREYDGAESLEIFDNGKGWLTA